MMHNWTTDTPAGPFTVLAEESIVYASGWTTDAAELAVLIARPIRPVRIAPTPKLGSISDAVRSYGEGDREAIDTSPYDRRAGRS